MAGKKSAKRKRNVKSSDQVINVYLFRPDLTEIHL